MPPLCVGCFTVFSVLFAFVASFFAPLCVCTLLVVSYCFLVCSRITLRPSAGHTIGPPVSHPDELNAITRKGETNRMKDEKYEGKFSDART